MGTGKPVNARKGQFQHARLRFTFGSATCIYHVNRSLWSFQLPAMSRCHFRSAAVRSALASRRRRAKFHGICLTSACPLPSSAASCLAAPPSGRAPPRRPSGPTGPASGPLLLASPRWPAGAAGVAFGWVGTGARGPGGARPLLIWGPGLGQP